MEPEVTPDTPYQYSGLTAQQIRLLELLPGSFSAGIKIKITIVEFTDDCNPLYEALSYVWGSQDDLVPIGVRDQGGTTLHITRNLATALPYFRNESRSRSLWVDAICIDQSNDVERSEQVTMMYDIFRKADRVVVWLGEEEDDSDIALSLLDQLGPQFDVDWRNGNLRPTSTCDPSYINPDYRPIYDRRTSYGLLQLFARPWFGRLWVIQEVHGSNANAILMCGAQVVPWQRFCTAVFYLSQAIIQFPLSQGDVEIYIQRRNAVNNFIWVSRQEKELLSFVDISVRTRYLQCSDPKDRVFAVQGMLLPHKALKPDYTRSVDEIYRDITLHTIRMGRRLEILTLCGLFESRGTCPTWVPRFDPTSSFTFDLGPSLAAGTTVPEVDPVDERTLQAEGLVFGEISQVQGVDSSSSGLGALVTSVRRIGFSTEKLETSYTAGGSTVEALCRIMIMNRFSDQYHIPGQSGREIHVGDYVRVFWSAWRNENIDREDAAFLDFNSDLKRDVNSSIFLTSDGYIGRVPNTFSADFYGASIVVPGEKIAVLLGCRYPMILRPSGDGKFEVVCPAYVHGLGNAEALLGPLPKPWEGKIHEGRYTYPVFVNKETGRVTVDDPRLSKDLPDGWTIAGRNEDYGGLPIFQKHGESYRTYDDPRLTSKELIKRGVKLETISLI